MWTLNEVHLKYRLLHTADQSAWSVSWPKSLSQTLFKFSKEEVHVLDKASYTTELLTPWKKLLVSICLQIFKVKSQIAVIRQRFYKMTQLKIFEKIRLCYVILIWYLLERFKCITWEKARHFWDPQVKPERKTYIVQRDRKAIGDNRERLAGLYFTWQVLTSLHAKRMFKIIKSVEILVLVFLYL